MKRTMLMRSRGWRRAVLLLGSAAAVALMIASVAYACILRTGTVLVCAPASKTYVNGTRCSKATGAGGQAGNARLSKLGSEISVKANNLYKKPYSIHFRVPGSTQDCTSHNGTTAQSLLGEDGSGKPNTVDGPRFYKKAKTPVVTTTGRAQICVVEQPDRTTAQTVNVTVI